MSLTCIYPESAMTAATRLGIRAIDDRAARLALQARAIIQDAIQTLVAAGEEDTARDRYGNEAVDAYFHDVEGIDVFAARVDVDELARKLEAIGDEVTELAHSIGLPDPGAASTEDLVREMWAKVHASLAARGGGGIDESRALGWHA